MDVTSFLTSLSLAASPLMFALLAGLAVLLMWMAFAPARPAQQVQERMEDYLDRGDIIEAGDMARPFAVRVLLPPLRGLLRFLGRLLPNRSVASLQQQLMLAGNPGRLSALDFMGLRLLSAIVLGAGFLLLFGRTLPAQRAFAFALMAALLGFILPVYWLRRKVRQRQHDIQRALPDALDMLTIGVEAGLAFESALLRVGERWDNPLTQEFRRAVAEMRMGASRNEALQRMSDRTGVPDLRTFVAVLIQSSQLGVSIAEVLHSQAEQMRIKRRQRAEELARQAGVKMVFPLVLFIFPAMFIVTLGPAIPRIAALFSSAASGGGLQMP